MSHWIITGWPASSISSSVLRALRALVVVCGLDGHTGALAGRSPPWAA